jgi:hypothetical protein
LGIFKIIFTPRSSIDITQANFISLNNSDLSINRRSQALELFQLLLLSLPIVSPTLIELISGILFIFAKYTLTENVSTNDIYLIHSIPTFLGLTPLCLKEIKSSSRSHVLLEDIWNPYVYFGIVLNTLICIGLNTLVLISGGLIGLSICNNYLL